MTRLVLVCTFGILACGDPPAAPSEPDARGLVLPTAPRPGPCVGYSNGEAPYSCTMSFDGDDRVTGMDCLYVGACQTGAQWNLVYEADGRLGLITRSGQECDTALFFYDAIDLGEPISGTERRSRAVYRDETSSTYEAELVLARHPFEDQISLLVSARDSLLTTHHEFENGGASPTITEHTYTYDGPPHQGTRTRTRDDGAQVTFEYDAQGRLIAASADGDTPARTYEYDGDLMVRDGSVTYEHDEHGNLLRRIDGGVVTLYDYGCWE
jgi:YD repeat-containing protein